jgi:IS30 family transposase
MKQGLNNSEACRLVGIHRSTGQHWRHGRRLRNKGREYYYRPITAPPPPVSARFLSEDERVRIADLHRLGWSTRVIARICDRVIYTQIMIKELIDKGLLTVDPEVSKRSWS